MIEDAIQILRPDSIETIRSMVRDGNHLVPRGGGTKPVLSSDRPGFSILEMRSFNKIIEYEPDELTFTAYAGTPIKSINEALVDYGQFLPFDPPLVKKGATLGGVVAAGVSGPGRFQYGGIRDFILGVQYIDSQGQLIRGGGKVVKNAAGFDLPKLMVGSRGGLGILTELSFKVFPIPETYISFRVPYNDLNDALEAQVRATSSALRLAALDIEVLDQGYNLWVRLGGRMDTMPARQDRLLATLESGELLQGSQELNYWRDVCELEWIKPDWTWIVVPITPRRIPEVEKSLSGLAIQRRYISGGQALWLGVGVDSQPLNETLMELGLRGLVLSGKMEVPIIGATETNPFLQRVKSALDPENCFVEV